MNADEKLIENLKQIHITMCCCFRDACKEEATIVKDPRKYQPEAIKSDRYLRMCEDFENFISKYFGIQYNPRTNKWKEK